MKPGDRVRFLSGLMKDRIGAVTTNDQLTPPQAPSSSTIAVKLDRPIDGVRVVQASAQHLQYTGGIL